MRWVPSQQAKHSGKRGLKDPGLLSSRQAGSREHERSDASLAQCAQLDLALTDLLVLREQDPAPSANLGEPLHVLRATPECILLHVRDVAVVVQHGRNWASCDALVDEELVWLIRRRGRA